MSTPPQLPSQTSSENSSSTASSSSLVQDERRGSFNYSSSFPVSDSLFDLSPLPSISPNDSFSAFGLGENTADWLNIALSEVVQQESVVCTSSDTSIERASEYLNEYNYTSIPIQDSSQPKKAEYTAVGNGGILEACSPLHVRYAFDYSDLNTYLLLVLGHSTVDLTRLSEENQRWLKCAKSGLPVPVQFAISLQAKEPFEILTKDCTLAEAVLVLGRGVHRIMVTNGSAGIFRNDAEDSINGILSQRRFIKYIWENGRRFPSLQPLFQASLHDLNIGNYEKVISIRGDALVLDALKRLSHEEVSSLAVVDSQGCLLGNISVVDVKMLTKSTNAPLLKSTCLTFLNVLLYKRGLSQGQDSYPVFHVTKHTLLGSAIAKLVATQAHRLWIVDDGEPEQPNLKTSFFSGSSSSSASSISEGSELSRERSKSLTPHMSYKLIGVVSLTDIINRLGQVAGKRVDPHSVRHQRRRSSIVSVKNLAN
ncbi:hypothetical protein NADFUDRAFT_28746 [Nadsonia fulvescens var. elongata DSM 6958]|uniref:CBS domain-containing protein n=1 Tax=Nadsonia fulvescens var. elongata DSM 6958 TaxID=857566 RepID=A0A1E3PDM9_9ASCO|nr:hypothetical protein NADFUDRAFT_28746 [Nadsonia fulvescens var. elongata DSM 6958]